MGRKIPGRKHRGVRDPEKQRQQRLEKIKHKINAPPADPDEQHVPKSLQRIAELTNKVKSGAFKRKKPKQPRRKGMFEQRPQETDHQFLVRVNREVAVVKHEAAFEQKFGVEIQRDENGEVQVKKRPKDPIQVMLKEAKRDKKKKKKKEGDKDVLTKSQKRRLKLMEKKQKKVESNDDEFKQFQDKVKFGEQAHEPPTLTVPRRVKNENGAQRPGKKDLLLKTMLSQTSNKVIDKTGKRKNLPNALRRQLDKQQKEIIDAYRQIKEKKREVQ